MKNSVVFVMCAILISVGALLDKVVFRTPIVDSDLSGFPVWFQSWFLLPFAVALLMAIAIAIAAMLICYMTSPGSKS